MPLYKILSDETVERVKSLQFQKEKVLQNLIEKNIDAFFGIILLESEYSMPNGRIDSLCIDTSGVPVVIEYKKKKDLSAIIQGLFYVDWLKSNKRTFELIVKEKLSDAITVDWRTPSRLIIIAEEFDQKETSAINQINASVELIKFSFFGDLISFENINLVKPPTASSSKLTVQQQAADTVMPLSIDSVLEKGSPRVQEIFQYLRDFVLNISDEIDERVNSSMISYYSNSKGFIWIQPAKNAIKIHLRKGGYDNRYDMIKTSGGYGGYPEINIKTNQYNEEIEKYIKEMIVQAYNN